MLLYPSCAAHSWYRSSLPAAITSHVGNLSVWPAPHQLHPGPHPPQPGRTSLSSVSQDGQVPKPLAGLGNTSPFSAPRVCVTSRERKPLCPYHMAVLVLLVPYVHTRRMYILSRRRASIFPFFFQGLFSAWLPPWCSFKPKYRFRQVPYLPYQRGGRRRPTCATLAGYKC